MADSDPDPQHCIQPNHFLPSSVSCHAVPCKRQYSQERGATAPLRQANQTDAGEVTRGAELYENRGLQYQQYHPTAEKMKVKKKHRRTGSHGSAQLTPRDSPNWDRKVGHNYRKRINTVHTEERAKVVASVWG